MNTMEYKAIKLASTKTNHILHLLLTIFTGGLWAIVWLLVTMSNAGSRREGEDMLNRMNTSSGFMNLKNTERSTDDEPSALRTIYNVIVLIIIVFFIYAVGMSTDDESVLKTASNIVSEQVGGIKQ